MSAAVHRHVLGLLSRPRLEEGHLRALSALVGQDSWKPLPRIPSANVLEPIYSHHLLSHGMEPTQVFQNFAPGVARPPEFVDLVHGWAKRRERIRELAQALEESAVRQAMIFKGAATAFLYPVPALRQMSDLDFVVADSDLPAMRDFLRTRGYEQFRNAFSEMWGCRQLSMTVDLHVARSDAARAIMQRALPATRALDSATRLTIPHPTDHLILVALHAADNAGNRLWTDVCDAQALIADGADSSTAIERSKDWEAEPAVRALVAFLANWCGLDFVDTNKPAGEARQLLELFEAASVQETSPMELTLLGNIFYDTPRRCLRALRRGSVRSEFAPAGMSERDPILGKLPAGGSRQRHALKLRLLWRELRQGVLFRNARLAYRQARLRKKRRMFATPEA